jgi:MscS family membrane protein
MNRWKSLLFLVVWLVPAVGHSQATDCSSPWNAVDTLLYWQQPGRTDMDTASMCLDDVAAERRVKLARQLKAILDGRGLFVEMDRVPSDPGYIDPKTQQPRYVLFPHNLPEVYLVQLDEQWRFSPETIGAIPSLHKKTFSMGLGDVAERLPPGYRRQLAGIAVWQLLGVLLLMLASMAVRVATVWLGRHGVALRFERLLPDWGAKLVDGVSAPLGTMAAAGLWAWLFPSLEFHVRINQVAMLAIKLVAALSLVWLLLRLVDVVTEVAASRAELSDTKLDDQLVPLLRRSLKVFVVILGIIFVLQNMEVDVGSLLAGLGIGGLAFALAAKDMVANLFGSIMIFTDRPFQIGDYVIGGGTEGTVEEVRFRSTRIRSRSNSIQTVPNNILANAIIDNMSERSHRRVRMTLGLTYDTNAAQMQAFCEGVRAVLLANPFVRKDNYQVYFNGFGASSLDILVDFHLGVAGWGDELRERHNISMEVLRLAEAIGVGFAFPTQTLHVESMVPASEAPPRTAPDESGLEGVVLAFGPGGDRARPTSVQVTEDGFVASPDREDQRPTS